MAEFSVNTQRFDPYKNFKFRVRWDGRYVAGVSKVGALKRTTEVVEHRVGGDPSTSRKSPGRSKFEAITLERGVTHDTEFEKWVNKVWNFGAGLGGEVSLKDFRKDVIIEVYNEAGQLALAYKLYRCWPSPLASGLSHLASRPAHRHHECHPGRSPKAPSPRCPAPTTDRSYSTETPRRGVEQNDQGLRASGWLSFISPAR